MICHPSTPPSSNLGQAKLTRALICKHLRSPWVSIQRNRFRQTGNRFLGSDYDRGILSLCQAMVRRRKIGPKKRRQQKRVSLIQHILSRNNIEIQSRKLASWFLALIATLPTLSTYL
jgi:hypothetical protein